MLKTLKLPLIFVALLVGSPRNALAYSFYSPSTEATCTGKKKVYDNFEISNELLPATLDQGKTSSCFVHAAYYVFSHLVKRIYTPDVEPSILDFYAKGCTHENFGKGGQPSAVLLELLRHKDAHFVTGRSHSAPLPIVQEIGKVIRSPETTVSREQLHKVVSKCLQGCLTDPQTIRGELDAHRKSDHSLVKYLIRAIPGVLYPIPKYNIYLSHRKNIETNHISSELDHFVSANLKKEPPYPVIAHILTSRDRTTPSGHAITLTGSRQFCCDEVCHSELKVKNSYGPGRLEGWMDALLIHHFMTMALSVAPCESIECKNYVQGGNLKSDADIAISFNDEKSLDSILNEPSIAELIPEDLTNLVKNVLMKRKGNALSSLKKFGVFSQVSTMNQWNLAHLSAMAGKEEKLKDLLVHSSELFKQKDIEGMTPFVKLSEFHPKVAIALLRQNSEWVSTEDFKSYLFRLFQREKIKQDDIDLLETLLSTHPFKDKDEVFLSPEIQALKLSQVQSLFKGFLKDNSKINEFFQKLGMKIHVNSSEDTTSVENERRKRLKTQN